MTDRIPAVSVIIISYKGEQFLPKSIGSVLAQTFTDFELVIVEDGSRDAAESIVASFNDPRARYVWRPNGGTSAARNTGIRETTAPLVAFLDSDDWWDPRKLAAQVEALADHPDAGVVYTAAMMVTEGTTTMSLDPAAVQGDALPSLLTRNSIAGSASSVMVRRQVLEQVGGFDETVKFAEDWECWLRLAKATPFVGVERPDVYINVRPGSFGRKTDDLRLGAHAVVNKAFTLADQKYHHLKRIAHANIEFGASVDLAHHGKRRKAIVPLLRAIRYDPLRPKFWRRLVLMVLSKVWPTPEFRRRIITVA